MPAADKTASGDGVIKGYGAHIDLEMLGNHVVIFSEVTIVSHRRQHFSKFEETVAKHEEVVECYNVSGGYDYLLKIVAPSIMHFQSLMDVLLESDIGIDKFKSRIVLRQPLGQRKDPLGIIVAKHKAELPF